MGQLFNALFTVVVGVAGALLYFWVVNKILDLIWPPRGPALVSARNQRIAATIRPWLFLGPALLALGLYLVYPVFDSLRLSFFNRTGNIYVGTANYRWALNDGEFRQAIQNNIFWLIVVPALSTFFGLIIAFLTDRIWWGNIAKSLIFMPMAISFVGASVIWKFIYDYRGEGSIQIGLLNAIVELFGLPPQAWITIPFWNNFFLMVILIWIQTGFAMVILAAALRSVPEETIEAAVIDGANGWHIFFYMMFDWMFRGGGDFGRGAAIAVVIMVAVIPIMIWNIRRARAEGVR
jgi:alpha-glucoside transport system permease protein